MADQYSFENISLLVTHYNRSSSLRRLLNAFRDLAMSFGDIVVSDDGSKAEHLEQLYQLQEEFAFKLITTPQNKGLGHNINKGQDAVKTPLTLYVQEDFVPQEKFVSALADAQSFMTKDPTLDIVRFYAYFSYPYTKPYSKEFSLMYFSPSFSYTHHLKFYLYSDHPHLRRSSFLDKFGRYPEGKKGDETEFEMALSCLKNKARGLFYNDFNALFIQSNSQLEPSTMYRSKWRERKTPVVLVLRAVYLQFRFIKNTVQFYLK